MANRSVKPFLHSSWQKVPIIYNGRPYPPELPLQIGGSGPRVTHDALGPCEPTTQTAPRSVHPCLHRVECPYVLLWFACFPLKIAPSHDGRNVIHGSLGPPESCTQMATWSFQPFLQGSLVWQNDRVTDIPTDHGYSVQCGVIMRNYVGYGKATHSFHVNTNNFATIKSLSECLKHLINYLV